MGAADAARDERRRQPKARRPRERGGGHGRPTPFLWFIRRFPARESRCRFCSPEEASRGAVPVQDANRLRSTNRATSPTSANVRAATTGPTPWRSVSPDPRALTRILSSAVAFFIFASTATRSVSSSRRSHSIRSASSSPSRRSTRRVVVRTADDRDRVGVTGIGRAVVTGVEEPDPGRELGWDVHDLSAGLEEPLGQGPASTVAAPDRPDPVRSSLHVHPHRGVASLVGAEPTRPKELLVSVDKPRLWPRACGDRPRRSPSS